MKSFRLGGAVVTAVAAAALVAAGLWSWGQIAPRSFAQNVSAPLVPFVHLLDAVQVIPNGNPGPANVYATAGQVGAMDTYVVDVLTTGFSLTPSASGTLLILNPAGTLGTGTITMPANPSDGGRFCVMSTQTQTALTMTANTGQTLVGTAVTALTANAPPKCWRFIGQLADWFALQ